MVAGTYCRLVTDQLFPWRDELVGVAERLESKTAQKRWTDRTGHLIERDFIAGAHAVRRLIDMRQVPEALGRQPFPVRRFELTGTPPDPAAPDDIADSYDFENGRRRMLSITELCDEIIGSTVFAFCCGETADLFDGVYVSSDRHMHRYVDLVLASDFIALCSDLGTTRSR